MLGYKLFGSGGFSNLTIAAINDVGTGITAAGTDQAGATELTNFLNGLSTVAAASGVRLYACSTGDWQLVYNGGANAVKVYPPSGARINGLASNAPHTLATNTVCVYFFLSATQVVGVLSA